MEPVNCRLKSTRLTSFRSTVRQIESILRESTISTNHTKQVKSKLALLEGQFQQLLKWNRQLEAQEVRKQSKQSREVQQIITTATSRPNPLASLPDLCLLALFEQLPLFDQLTARQTCVRWSTLMLEVTQTRRSLTINLNIENEKVDYAENDPFYKSKFKAHWHFTRATDDLSHLQKDDGSPLFPCRRRTAWNRLYVASLSTTLNEQICTTFSRIKKLKLQVGSSKSFEDAEHLASLVEQLGPRLEAFHLSVFFFYLLSKSVVDRLYSAINSMSSLLYLKLYLPAAHHDLPIISRLEELHFDCSSTTPAQFATMLRQYGEGNAALRRIVYHYSSMLMPMQLGPFTRLSRRLRNCFTGFDYFDSNARHKLSLCDHFRSLTSIDITIDLPSTDFAKLSQLTQLVVLHLKLNFTNSEVSHRRPLPQLPSVTFLQLEPNLRSHRDLDQLAIPWTMPNVHVIYFNLTLSRCTDCHEGRFPLTELPANFECVLECTRQLFRPLVTQCARLRMIKHSEENLLGTVEELLAGLSRPKNSRF